MERKRRLVLNNGKAKRINRRSKRRIRFGNFNHDEGEERQEMMTITYIRIVR